MTTDFNLPSLGEAVAQRFPKFGVLSKNDPNYMNDIKKLSSTFKDVFKDFNNAIRAAKNDTLAANFANALALDEDIEIDGKLFPKGSIILADVFNDFVKETFPNVEFNPVQKYISVADATGSFTDYWVKQQHYENQQQLAELQAQSGSETAPPMGL